ncbi:hypothetical protein [Paracoccus sp. TOH]|uniref:17 kDa surface antigen n=1 Tax=Paracoccus simplex TaxID=2086346 RepID=A0ABV7S1E5_9RHOB|nr:hypothetical protein [Paracoccus sp. TOH]WJS87336.1 hypothetical protein NBE95_21930 [Paracoccus sp. TOH]
MRKFTAALLFATVTLAGCAGYEQSMNSAAVRTVGGAAAGAVVADATGGSKTKGALIGALAGGGSCAVTGNCR